MRLGYGPPRSSRPAKSIRLSLCLPTALHSFPIASGRHASKARMIVAGRNEDLEHRYPADEHTRQALSVLRSRSAAVPSPIPPIHGSVALDPASHRSLRVSLAAASRLRGISRSTVDFGRTERKTAPGTCGRTCLTSRQPLEAVIKTSTENPLRRMRRALPGTARRATSATTVASPRRQK